jgi:omega-6 fatty acid desaturase (delta-12 desaturase)
MTTAATTATTSVDGAARGESATPREGQALIDATKPFTKESTARSWWYTVQTFALLAATIAFGFSSAHWAIRLAVAVLAGLLTVRAFILYHDYQHGAILRGSKLARWIFRVYGTLVLTPPTVWRATHNYHHAHTAKIVGSHVGSYLTLTVDMYRQATPAQRFMYRVIRHPLTISIGYLTIFLWGMCLAPFKRNPRKHWDGLLAAVVHVALSALVIWLAGWQAWLFAVAIPLAVACASGAYLFYAQHNFPDIEIQPRETWSYTRAALHSSSYMPMNPVMQWLTGNIGYHHVHHLNPGIPFYRLPEAMAGVPELQNPHVTTLSPRDVLACFRLKLWDPQAGRMVGYEAAATGGTSRGAAEGGAGVDGAAAQAG